MDSYTDFARIYDIFMDNVPYEAWAERIFSLLKKHDQLVIPEGDAALASEAGLLVDLGCGTGVMTRLMSDRGYSCIGIDASPEMLRVAMDYESPGTDSGSFGSETDSDTMSAGQKLSESDKDSDSDMLQSQPDNKIIYLNQDMRSFELYSTAGAVISVCDSINYLLTDEDILSCFKSVNNYLYPRGLFIFDFNTDYYYASIGDDTIAENRPEGSFIWENYYDPETRINEYDLTLYIRDPEGRYDRSEETHTQRGYLPEDMIRLLEMSGLEVVEYFDADTGKKITKNTSRVCMVAREVSKKLP